MHCITKAWSQYESELRNYLRGQLNDTSVAEDLLQDTFVKAIAEGSRFCELENVRAWLYRVTKNRLIDYRRNLKEHPANSDQLSDDLEQPEAVTKLADCLPRALSALAPEDSHAIESCDLGGVSQVEYAKSLGISVAGAKSRVQRARKRLKQQLHKACQIRFDDAGKVCCFVPYQSDSKIN